MKKGGNDIFQEGKINKEEHSSEHSKSTIETNSKEKSDGNKEVELKPLAKCQKSESHSDKRSKKEDKNGEIETKTEAIQKSLTAQQINMEQYKVPTQIRPPLPCHNRRNKGKRGKLQKLENKTPIKEDSQLDKSENFKNKQKFETLPDIKPKKIEYKLIKSPEREKSNLAKDDSKISMFTKIRAK